MCSSVSTLTTTPAPNHHSYNDKIASDTARPRMAGQPASYGGARLAARGADSPMKVAGTCNGQAFEPAPEAGESRLSCNPALRTASSLARKLILVPHPGDEIACAGLLQHSRDPVVVFATDGMTEAECSCPTLRRQRVLRNVRRREATTALTLAGVRQVEFLSTPERKMEALQLYRAVGPLFEALCQVIARYQPKIILVPAYEGGHPDHDVCSFVGALIHIRLNLPVWEMPLYHKSDTGELIYQRFRKMNSTELIYTLGPDALFRRAAMVACYGSRRDFVDLEVDDMECYRPQAEYDYSQPPQHGTIHYENGHRSVSTADLCRQLALYAREIPIALPFPSSQRSSWRPMS